MPITMAKHQRREGQLHRRGHMVQDQLQRGFAEDEAVRPDRPVQCPFQEQPILFPDRA